MNAPAPTRAEGVREDGRVCPWKLHGGLAALGGAEWLDAIASKMEAGGAGLNPPHLLAIDVRQTAQVVKQTALALRDAEAEVAQLIAENERMREALTLPRIEFHQQDFIPGFAAFLPGATAPSPDSKAFCVLNLGSMLSTVYHGDTKREDLPYFLADSIMHEVTHVLEQWAGVEFSEERVDALIEKYRAALNDGASHAE